MNLSEKTQVTLDLKTIGIVIGGAVSLAALYLFYIAKRYRAC